MATTESRIEDRPIPPSGEPVVPRGGAAQRKERSALAIVAVLAAVPSLVAGLTAGFMSDDWGIWWSLQDRSVLDALHHVGFEQPGRPLAGFYYLFLYRVIGDVPLVHGLLIGVINAGVLVAAWLVGRRFLPATVLWPALLVLALAPNHAMTRIWFVAGYYPLSLTFVLVGLWLLDTGRTKHAAVCFVLAALLFEGVLGFGLGALAIWTVADVRQRLRRGTAVALPTVVALAVMYRYSSKRGGSVPFNNVDSLFSGQLGVGLWGSPNLARIAGGIVLVGLAWAIARQLPSFRKGEPESRLVLLGAALALAGAAPFVVNGFTFATTGVFDRNNLAAGFGVAVLMGALWSRLYQSSATAAAAVGVVVVGLFAAGQAEDLDNWSKAYDRGEEVIDRIAASGLDDGAPILVVPEQESGNTGMADFIYDGDLTGALRYRHGGDWARLRLIDLVACDAPARGPARIQVVDWRSGDVDMMTVGEVSRRCEDLRDG